MKKFSIASLLVALVMTGLGMFSAGPASASSTEASAQRAGCVTRAEYRAVRKGWKQTAVHAKFGTVGKRFSYRLVRRLRVRGPHLRRMRVAVQRRLDRVRQEPRRRAAASNKTAVWVG